MPDPVTTPYWVFIVLAIIGAIPGILSLIYTRGSVIPKQKSTLKAVNGQQMALRGEIDTLKTQVATLHEVIRGGLGDHGSQTEGTDTAGEGHASSPSPVPPGNIDPPGLAQ